MTKERLPDDAIARELGTLPGWQREGDALVRTFDRHDFDGSIAFVNAVAAASNAAGHHPDLNIAWNMVGIRLSSHDAGGITARDVRLAHVIDGLAQP